MILSWTDTLRGPSSRLLTVQDQPQHPCGPLSMTRAWWSHNPCTWWDIPGPSEPQLLSSHPAPVFPPRSGSPAVRSPPASWPAQHPLTAGCRQWPGPGVALITGHAGKAAVGSPATALSAEWKWVSKDLRNRWGGRKKTRQPRETEGISHTHS